MTRLPAIAALILSVLVGAAPASGQQEIAPADYARINAALAETHAVPRYEQLATATRDFVTAADALCVDTSDADREHGLEAARWDNHLVAAPVLRQT